MFFLTGYLNIDKLDKKKTSAQLIIIAGCLLGSAPDTLVCLIVNIHVIEMFNFLTGFTLGLTNKYMTFSG